MSRIETIKQLFDEASTLPGGVDRDDWLRGRCADDGALFSEVCSLLEAHAAMELREAANPMANVPLPAADFGPYRAVKLLGRGGTSVVYRGERRDGAFHQSVALKVMAAWLSGPDFQRRFDTERQLLASLNHPHIAHLLDGGVSSTGDPYLAVEHVEGERLDHYCDARLLAVEARVRLFLQVCDAVEYAHRNLVVHRDLKPGNILVTAEGQVKLLDFGTAALLAADRDATVTRTRMVTPRYASPERLRGERANTGNDVFSLGVILFELLTGKWPFGDPDSVLTELERATGDRAANAPEGLDDDLAAILLKAIENDARRRYGSVLQLADDLERYLEGKPVTARRQTAWYRTTKFCRRHWLPLAATLVFAGALSTAAVIAVRQTRVAQDAALKQQEVNRFMTSMLAPDFALDPKRYTVEQMIEKAEKRIDASHNVAPLTEAMVRLSLGNGYKGLTQWQKAKPQIEKALAIFQAQGDDREAAAALGALAEVVGQSGQYREASALYEKALDRLRRYHDPGARMMMFDADQGLAENIMNGENNEPRARRLLEHAIAIGESEPSIPRASLASARGFHGALLIQEANKIDEGESEMLRALEEGSREDPGGVWQLTPLLNLSVLYGGAKKDKVKAERYGRKLFEVALANYGPENPLSMRFHLEWAGYYADLGEKQAEEVAPQAIEMLAQERKAWGDSLQTARSFIAVTRIFVRAGRYRDAEDLGRRCVAEAVQSKSAPSVVGNCYEFLAEAYHGMAQYRQEAATWQFAAEAYDHAPTVFQKTAARARQKANEASALIKP